jgi:hypothetical protein
MGANLFDPAARFGPFSPECSPGSSEYVADLGSRAGTVFGWLLEAGGTGDFV